ncbi:MAG: class I SAM-dependent RNA methyltransferase [Eubacteriales bacterium]|nr:class I SAM-dependent RNA methyltransferase [Eubacteriales bacterium]
MKKGQIFEAVIEGIDFPDKGFCHIDDRKVSIKQALPGQKVRFSIKKAKSGKAEGRLMEVLEPSFLETQENVCRHFGSCGGCIYQSIPYKEQLAIKAEQVKNLMQPVFDKYNQTLIYDGVVESPVSCGYRNKMEYTFGDEVKDGDLSLGMHKRGSFHDIVTVEDCRIADEDFSVILKAVLAFFKERNLPYYHRMRHTGYLRHLLVRKTAITEEILVDLVTSSAYGKKEEIRADEEIRATEGENADVETEEMMLKSFTQMLCGLSLKGKLTGILHTYNDSLADIVQNDRTDLLYGRSYIVEKLLGLQFKITPFSFFQTNSRGAEVLYSIARDYIGDTRDCNVFDLYSGTGTIAQMLAPAAGKVTGVEIVEEAVEAAKENAALNGLTNCTFLAGDVLKVLDTIEDKPDLLVLDPPRDGIHPKALPKLLAYDVERMVYISCKPTSLARDLEMFFAHGYEVKKMCSVDMFPGTGNVEAVVLLSKGEVDSKKIRVEFSLEDMDMSEFQDGATYPQIKEYVLEHSGLKVSSLYISQIKRKCGLEVGKNYNHPKSEDSRQPQCPPEKEKAIREAFKYFGMI